MPVIRYFPILSGFLNQFDEEGLSINEGIAIETRLV